MNIFLSFLFLLCLGNAAFSTSISQPALMIQRNEVVAQVKARRPVPPDEILERLDFVLGFTEDEAYDQGKFQALLADHSDLINKSKKLLRHNHLQFFLDSCASLISQQHRNVIRFALYKLAEAVLKGFEDGFRAIEPPTAPDPEVELLPDQAVSVVWGPEQLPEGKTRDIFLGPRNLEEPQFSDCKQQWKSLNLPLRVSTDLLPIGCKGISAADGLRAKLLDLDSSIPIAELVFKNGGSRKFNLLWETLQEIYQHHNTSDTPITIIYSSTSLSQKAHRKLYDLTGASPLPAAAEHMEAPQLTVAVRSPPKSKYDPVLFKISPIEPTRANLTDLRKLGETHPLVLKLSPSPTKTSGATAAEPAMCTLFQELAASRITFEHAYKRSAKLDDPTFLEIEELYGDSPGWFSTDPKRQDAFLSSAAFQNICFLDLKDQGVDDDFVQQLAKSPHFPRLCSIDLRGNPSITVKALDALQASDSIGSVRQMSLLNQEGSKVSPVTVYTGGLENITDEVAQRFSANPRKSFTINYRRLDGIKTEPPTKEGSKIIVVNRTEA